MVRWSVGQQQKKSLTRRPGKGPGWSGEYMLYLFTASLQIAVAVGKDRHLPFPSLPHWALADALLHTECSVCYHGTVGMD